MANWSIIVPKAKTNYVTNPSVEFATTGWSTTGTNTIGLDATEQKRGAYSLKCTYNNSTTLASYAFTAPAGGTYAVSADVFMPSNWDGGAISLSLSGYTSGAVVTASTTYAASDAGDGWKRLVIVYTIDAGDLSGTIVVSAGSAPTAGRFIYVDGLQAEDDAETTYIDGDLPLCSWLSAAHGSYSVRPLYDTTGGAVTSFDADLSFAIAKHAGAGMPATRIVLQERMTGGAVVQRIKYLPRQLLLTGDFDDPTSLTAFHSARQALILAVAPHNGRVDTPAPRILRYTGAAEAKEIAAYYEAGLELNRQDGFNELYASLRFLAVDPFFREIGESGAVWSSAYAATTFRCFGGKVGGAWSNLGPPDAAGTYANGRAVLAHPKTGLVYLVGDFLNFDNIAAADYAVVYDPTDGSYAAVGGAFNGEVYGMALCSDGDVLFFGAFTTHNGNTANCICRWDGASMSYFAPTGSTSLTGIYGAVEDAIGDIVVVGVFEDLAGVSGADNIAKYDISGTSWVAVGGASALNSDAYAVVIDAAGDIVVGGNFTNAGAVAEADYIAKYDGSTWSAFSTGMNDYVYTLLLTRAGELYAGGLFSTAGGNTVNKIARWNGTTWLDLDAGVPGSFPCARLVELRDGSILAMGNFYTTSSGLQNVGGVIRWNGSQWTHLDFAVDTTTYPEDFDELPNGDLYAALAAGSAYIPGYLSIDYAGTADARPRFFVKRTGGTSANLRYLANETTGAVIFLDYDMADGEEITIDFDEERLIMRSSVHGEKWSAFANSDVTTFALVPGNESPKANSFALLIMPGSIAPTLDARLTWHDTFLSVD